MSETATIPQAPIMYLDDSMDENYMAPVHPETGEIWHEKQWELVELATAWRYESDDDIRKEAKAAYDKARDGVKFESSPLFKESSFMVGAAFKDAVFPKVYHCHPNTWAKVPDERKAGFEVRKHEPYKFTSDVTA